MTDFDVTRDCQCNGLLSAYVQAEHQYDEAYEKFRIAEEELKEYYSEKMQKLIEALRMGNNPYIVDDYGDLNGDLYDSYLNFLRERYAERFEALEKAEEAKNKAENLLEGCETEFETCDKCDEHFSKNVWSCIEQCAACGRWYCRNCYDPEIEELEMNLGFPL